jgi:hypothetical protein
MAGSSRRWRSLSCAACGVALMTRMQVSGCIAKKSANCCGVWMCFGISKSTSCKSHRCQARPRSASYSTPWACDRMMSVRRPEERSAHCCVPKRSSHVGCATLRPLPRCFRASPIISMSRSSLIRRLSLNQRCGRHGHFRWTFFHNVAKQGPACSGEHGSAMSVGVHEAGERKCPSVTRRYRLNRCSAAGCQPCFAMCGSVGHCRLVRCQSLSSEE